LVKKKEVGRNKMAGKKGKNWEKIGKKLETQIKNATKI
jgi:hypothetical protein